ncbi:MAG: 50S ribosomal protein L25 [Sedimentisphaerales bacterium]|nr:50S ribosomal protein L25 [Sedimentisphaerales bacterium]
MVETIVLKLEKREGRGTAASRRLRKQGLIPVIVYGHGADPVSAAVSLHDITLELQHHHKLVDVELDGKSEKLLIKDVQYDHLYDKIIHVDMTRVNLNERVTVTVPVVLRGTPAGAAEDGVLDQLLADVELECLVTAIPEEVRVKVSDMQVGDTILAKDIKLPQGSVLVTDPETAVATVRVIAEELEAEAEVAEEGAAEPEVIAREKESEEGEES